MRKKVSLIICITCFFMGFCTNIMADPKNIDESVIDKCQTSSDCIIVPYSSCCGSTKRAINRKYKKIYDTTPEWQVFNDEDICAMIGKCPDDFHITKAICSYSGNVGRCELVRQGNCSSLQNVR